MRVAIVEFLDTDVFKVSVENCISFLDPMIDSWDIDLKTFGMEVVLNRRLTAGSPKRFEFTEQELQQPFDVEPGLKQFLKDAALSGDATEEEIEFLKVLKFRGKQPSPIYYYRELQNLRDQKNAGGNWIVRELRPAARSPAIAGVTPEARAYTCPVPRACLMLSVERDSLRQEHWATVQKFRAAIRDLVVLVDNSSLDSAAAFNLAQIRIGAARGVYEVARATLGYHQAEYGC